MSDKNHRPRFVTEGMFLALPAGFPGVAAPLPLDATRLVRLAGPDRLGTVFAAGAGPNPRVFQFMPKAPYGYAASWQEEGEEILGMGALEVASRSCVVLLIRTADGFKLVLRPSIPASEGIQEWGVNIPRELHIKELPASPSGSMAVDRRTHTIHVADARTLWSLRADPAKGIEIVEEVRHGGTGTLLDCGRIVLADRRDGRIFLLEPGGLAPAITIPELCDAQALTSCGSHLLWAGGDGAIFSWQAADHVLSRHGRVGMSPVTALARLPDGRIYGFAGGGIAHWFRLDPGAAQATDLGVAASVLTERRYGFEFSALLPGAGGEIYCAENDRGGHLWTYFPPLV